MTLVVDASTVVAALVNDAAAGEWALALLATESLVAPHHMPIEAVGVLRRAAAAGDLSHAGASSAHRHLVSLPVEMFPYAPLAPRVWELRRNVTPYAAWYVALAESLDAPLATVDVRLARAAGVRCRVVTPPH